MKRIGLISDTHSYLDPAVFRCFDQCDEIWHAGDIGSAEVADELSSFRPFLAVHGNIDGTAIRGKYPEELRFLCEDTDVYITHVGGYPGRYASLAERKIRDNPPALFICGHSHILKVMYDKKYRLLHMNPGAAGRTGIHLMRTLLRFSIDGKEIKNPEVIELGKR